MKLSDKAKATYRAVDKRAESAAARVEKYDESLRKKTENVQPSPKELPSGVAKNVTINVNYAEEIFAVLRDEKLQLKEAIVVDQVIKIGANLNPVFKILVRVGESKPFVGCAIAELFQESLIGITVSQVDRNINLIHIPLSDRNRKKIQMHRLK